MKKALFTIGLIILALSSFAQSVKFGIETGLNLSNLVETESGMSSSGSTLKGYRMGVFADVGLGDWSLKPGLIYSTKGGRNDVAGTIANNGSSYTYTGTEQLTFNYVEVPVNLLYHFPVVIGKIFLGGGPYVAIGTSGTDALSTTAINNGVTAFNSTSTQVTFGSAVGDFKKIDYGINLTGGLSLKSGLLFGVGYSTGLANLANDGSTLRNNVISFSVGFTFL